MPGIDGYASWFVMRGARAGERRFVGMGSETVGEAQGRKLGRDRRLGVGHKGDAHLEEPGAVELREARLPGVVVVEEGRLTAAIGCSGPQLAVGIERVRIGGEEGVA